MRIGFEKIIFFSTSVNLLLNILYMRYKINISGKFAIEYISEIKRTFPNYNFDRHILDKYLALILI